MKIIRLLTRLNGGGPVQQVAILNKAIPNSILIFGSLSKGEVDASYLAEGLRRYYIPELQREINLIKDFKAFLKIYDIIKTEKPDIIHTHTSKAGLLGRLSGMLFKRFYLNDTRLYHTFHGNVLDNYFNHCKALTIVIIERFLARYTDNIIAISESQKQELLKYKIGNGQKIKVIELGLELEKYYFD